MDCSGPGFRAGMAVPLLHPWRSFGGLLGAALKLALLANGPSLANHDISRITIPVCGMNRSHKVYQEPTFAVGLESSHYRDDPAYFDRLAKRGALYVVGGNWPCG